MVEPPQELRIVVRADNALHRPLRAGLTQSPTGVHQRGHHKDREQVCHVNLLDLEYTPVGRLGDVAEKHPTGRLALDVLAYVGARLLLVAALTAAIFYGAHAIGIAQFPLVVALLFGIIIAMPLGIWLLRPLRERATAGIAAVDERRRADRAQLQSRLRGDDPRGQAE